MTNAIAPEHTTLMAKDGAAVNVCQVHLVPRDGGFIVDIGAGPAGTNLPLETRTPQPVDYPTARKIYDQAVAESMAKGSSADDPQPISVVPHLRSAQPRGADAEWSLVWSDEFDGTTVDASKWNIDDRSTNNSERQYYLPDEVYLEPSMLVLRSRVREHKRHPYTSGCVNTRDKFAQTYGRFEVRARLPGGKGMWPAHWLMPADLTWPPEIDIMEMLGHLPARIQLHNHWGTQAHHLFRGSYHDLIGGDSAADFHVYAVDWTPGLVQWRIDGEVRFESPIGIADKPFYIILNTAVGGDWPGYPDATTVFPGYHHIDYVRVYRRAADIRPASVWLASALSKKPIPAGDVIITAGVADTDRKTCKVEFFHGDRSLGTSTTPPYTVTWKQVPPGAYELSAKVGDALNKGVRSAKVRVVVE